MDVGFIGLGMMGIAMAQNLAKAGHRVHAWNRSGGQVEGVAIVASPREAFANADVVFTMLSDDQVIREVVLASDALSAARAGAVHVCSSTISVAFAEELAALHAKANIAYVSAPVFGRPDVAAAGQLNIVVAGAKSAVEKVKPLFDVIGKKAWVMGEDPKQANSAKLAGNMMIALAIESMAEAVVLTSSNGVAPEVFFELMLNTLFAGRAYENYSGKITKKDFEPGFKMKLGLKDLRLASAAAEATGKELPLLDAVRTRMTKALESGLGEKDWSAVAEFTIRG